MNRLKIFFGKHPVILALLVIVFTFWLIWWFNQPIKVIYKSDGPLYWWDDDGYH